jgi:predicted O-methyltransferase YrrM
MKGNISPYEAEVMQGLIKQNDFKSIFEIGTFDGYSALKMSEADPDATIYTLDLPNGTIPEGLRWDDKDNIRRLYTNNTYSLGRLFKGKKNVIQLYGNSMDFDFTPYFDKINMVFIDGAHSWNYVRSDTSNALKMVKANGIVLWHDYYLLHPEVWFFLKRMGIRKIKGTNLGIFKK